MAGAHGGGLARDSNLYPPAARGVGQPRDSNPYPLPAASQSPSASEPGPSALTVSEGSSLTTGGAGAEVRGVVGLGEVGGGGPGAEVRGAGRVGRVGWWERVGAGMW